MAAAIVEPPEPGRHLDIDYLWLAKTFDLAWVLVQGILQCSDSECQGILHSRMVGMSNDTEHMTYVILEMHEALDIMDHAEKKEMQKEKSKGEESKQDLQEFQHSYKAKSKLVREVTKGKLANNCKLVKDGTKGKKGSSRYPKLPVADTEVSQAEARVLLPPGCSIWRALVHHAWCCHFHPYSRKSFAFQVYGDTGSMLECLRFCWRCHLLREGLEEEHCPIQGLFKAQGAPSSSS